MLGLVLVIFFYLVTGYILFRIGLSQYGGEDAYLESLKQEGFERPLTTYRVACFMFLFIWPFFLIRGIFNKNDE